MQAGGTGGMASPVAPQKGGGLVPGAPFSSFLKNYLMGRKRNVFCSINIYIYIYIYICISWLSMRTNAYRTYIYQHTLRTYFLICLVHNIGID